MSPSPPSGPGLVLLPDRLFWRPEADTSCAGGDIKELRALDLCRHGGGKDAKYGIPHYTPDACGAAFGPLSLAHLLRFCRGLDAALEEGAVALTTPKGDTAARMNALVMVGGYLIATCAWSAKKVASTIGTDANLKFICSWSRSKTPESECVMTVSDVWRGLNIAVKRFWLQPECMEDDAKLEAVISRYYLRTYCFDATWVIPGLLMVAADPTTVVFDPNPATCKRLVPAADGDGGDEACDSVASPPSPTSPTSRTSDAGWRSRSKASVDTVGTLEREMSAVTCRSSRSKTSSVNTVSKEFGENYEDMLPADPGSLPQDYGSFLVQSGIGVIVRANFDREEGMPVSGYGDGTFAALGLEQVNIPVVDTHGGLPKPRDLALMIDRCGAYLDSEGEEHPSRRGVFVHCKGGFGRSMVFAICLAIYRYDLPGSALLGWARVVRPGAITTRKQELFLKALKGADDVRRYARLPKASSPDSAGASCAGCGFQ